MSFHVYNTLSENKEPLPETRPLRMFVCGPTVYNHIHIGNARTYMSFDLIARYLRQKGVDLFYLQNITDVDDRIIAVSQTENKNWKEVSEEFEEAYFQVLKNLGIDSVTKYARATDYIPQIVEQVKTLIAKGHAYEIAEDGWYFDLSTFPEYGKLAHRTMEQAEDGVSRIDESDGKRNRGDFCLWKFSKPGEPVWETELAAGRPGWHIEDTAITEHFFGPQYDIHGGGLDLKFPHHEAELTQQESASGKKPFVKIWMHAGLVLTGGAKMSKSKSNFILMKDLLEKYSADIFRMAVFQQHYRSPMDWTDELANQASKNLASFMLFIQRLKEVAENPKGEREIDVAKYAREFEEAMLDDFNSPRALAALFGAISEANQDFWSLSKESAVALIDLIQSSLEPLGFNLKMPEVPQDVAKLVAEREEYRRNKQFMQADELRAEIERLGYIIEDTSLGPFCHPRA